MNRGGFGFGFGFGSYYVKFRFMNIILHPYNHKWKHDNHHQEAVSWVRSDLEQGQFIAEGTRISQSMFCEEMIEGRIVKIFFLSPQVAIDCQLVNRACPPWAAFQTFRHHTMYQSGAFEFQSSIGLSSNRTPVSSASGILFLLPIASVVVLTLGQPGAGLRLYRPAERLSEFRFITGSPISATGVPVGVGESSELSDKTAAVAENWTFSADPLAGASAGRDCCAEP